MTSQVERRKHDRTDLDLSVRFVAKENKEVVGRLIDISEGGLAVFADTKAMVGDPVIAYPDGLGRLTGTVARVFDGGVAIALEISKSQRDHLRKRIQSAVTGIPYIRMLEFRQSTRLILNLESEAIVESDASKFPCEIYDISLGGSAIRSTEKPPLGAIIRVGSLRGVVRRHTKDGFALEFAKDDDALHKKADDIRSVA